MHSFRLRALALAAMSILPLAERVRAQDWPMHRGDAGRTGCVDGQPGPGAAKVLWVHAPAKHQFPGSLSASPTAVYAPSLGPLNTSALYAVNLDPAAPKRALWSKTPPYLKLPAFGAPAVVGGDLIFGDGVHHTDGASLRCVTATGLPLWQLDVPGTLVHIESTPCAADGKLYFSSGHGGVFCVDPSVLTAADGKTLTRAQAVELMQKARAGGAEDNELPVLAPKVVWRVGKDQWHVDAPLAAAGGNVLVASSFLDKEQQGKRALICLNAADGAVRWETPLTTNPWGGATVMGDMAYVGCSNIGMYINLLPSAKGEVLAIRLKDGSVAWKKPIKGGVVSSVAAKDGLVVFTATDGKIRAFDAAAGGLKWSYEAGAPFFAAPAVAGDKVYAGDLKGVVHAINLATGTPVWKLNLDADPVASMDAGGKILAGPIVVGGKLYIGTCNLESSAGRHVLVCIGQP